MSAFVDDVVRGRLPLVCAKTGEPADLVIRMRQPVGSGLRSWAWLLVFFGPPGWLALLVVLMVAPAGEYLTVRIPYSRAAYDHEKLLGRLKLAALGLLLTTLLGAFVQLGMFPWLWVALAATFLLAAVVLQATIYFQTIGVTLDASRRWVTLTNVHPAFVRAVEDQERLTARSHR